MKIPEGFFYTKDHEWLEQRGEVSRIGITEYAQSELGDIVFVELPEEGQSFAKGDTFCNIESVKAVSEVYSPITGTVVAVNTTITDAPEQVNSSAFGEGWLVELKADDVSEIQNLMTHAQYRSYVEEVSK